MKDQTTLPHCSASSVRDAEAIHRINAAEGYLELGAPLDALKELAALDKSITGMEYRNATSIRLLALGMVAGPEISGPASIRELENKAPTGLTLEVAIIEALNLNQPALALQIAERYLEKYQYRANVNVLRNKACALTQLGRHEEALAAIFESLQMWHHDHVYVLLDAHLFPIWHYLADGAFGLSTANILIQPVFSELATAANDEKGIRSTCWHTAHTFLPQDITVHMRRDAFFMYYLRPDAPCEVRRRYLAWMDNHRHRMARLLRRAIAHAQRRVKECADLCVEIMGQPKMDRDDIEDMWDRIYSRE